MGDWIKKILGVIFLTLLIWAWAFLSLETSQPWVAVLRVAPVADTDYLISFNKGQDQVDKLQLTFKGAPTKISEMVRRYRNERMEFFYDPKEFGHERGGTFTVDLMDFIRRNPKVREYALTLETCLPEKVEVVVERLVKKPLVIQCVDEAGAIVKHETIEPSQVEVPVRQDYNGPAMVMLTKPQMERARKLPVEEKPYVEIVSGKRRYAEELVEITLPATEQLNKQPINPMVGYIISPTMLGQYKVELVNESDFKTISDIRGTEKAFDAYKKQRFQILVEVREGDAALPEIPIRPVIYNFPPEFIKSGQIEAPTPPLTARIRLVPLTSPTTPTTTTSTTTTLPTK
jgi:flagellar biosynthesis regulator FlbT